MLLRRRYLHIIPSPVLLFWKSFQILSYYKSLKIFRAHAIIYRKTFSSYYIQKESM